MELKGGIHINKQGFTLIELIIALAVMSVILLIAIPNYSATLDISKEKLCVNHRHEIMDDYKIFSFTDKDLTLEKFVENSDKYFDKELKCPSGGTYSVVDGEIICSIHGKIDETLKDTVKYDFSSDDFAMDQLSNPITNRELEDWEIVEKDGKKYLSNKKTGQNRIFLENDYSQYSITSKLALGGDILHGNGNTKRGRGYGISFETSTDKNGNDTGYIFQFDSGYSTGKFLFRKRTNGRESSPFLVIEPSDVIPGFTNNYWTDEHDVKVDVTDHSPNKKQVKIYIDGTEITNGKEVIVDSLDKEKQNYVGIRTWDKSTVYAESLEYGEIKE